MSISRRDAMKIAIATASIGVNPAAGDEGPRVGDLCAIRYRVQGNGPWNYMVERPSEGVTHAQHIGLYVGETDHDYLTAHSFAIFADGRIEPVHTQHWGKSGGSQLRIIRRA